jgi:hypothetical protein
MTIAAGTKLGRYEIRSKIGEGGMGEVYLAHDEKLNRDVAIKVLPAAFSADEGRLRRFEQEAQATGALNHPNILAVYDVGIDNGAPYVVSESLAGETLRERLELGPLASRRTTDFAIQLTNGHSAANQPAAVTDARTNRLLHCLEKGPERRFQSASDVAFALEFASDFLGSGSVRATASVPSSRTRSRERLVWITVTAVLLLAAAGALFTSYFRKPSCVRLAVIGRFSD